MTKKELFIQNICKPIAEMTERDDHSGAVVALCEYYYEIKPDEENAANLLKWAKYIKEEHNRLGHLTEPLLDFRHRVMHDTLRLLYHILGQDYVNELHKAL